MSGGIDVSWRRKAIDPLAEIRPKRILDVATGTADFAIAALRLEPDEVVGVDIAEEMLKLGRAKVEKRGAGSTIRLLTGEAERLDFNDGYFDAAMVAFGARNFEDLERGLGEMHRVIRPGGKIVVLEFSRPRGFPFRQIYFFYFRRVVPIMGRIISRSKEAYLYLPETVMKFPEGREFLSILQKVGFKNCVEARLTLGIASVYTGVKS